MSCSKIRNLLSEYLDGEIQGVDREMVSEHLAHCEDCARELAALRSTSVLLSEAADVEPPAFLLEQIEAATVNRPTLLGKVRSALDTLTRVPAPARWAMASAAVVAAVALTMVSLPSNQPGDNIRISEVKRPAQSATTPQHAPTQVVPAQPEPQPVVAAKTSTVARSVRPVRSRRSGARDYADAVRKHSAQPVEPAEPRTKEIPNADPDEAEIAEPIPSELPENNEAILASTPTAPEEQGEIKIARASTEQKDWQAKEADALADLRTKIAARNKQRRQQVQTLPIEGKKVSVELASIRF